MALQEIAVQLDDLDVVIDVLNACRTYFQALDITDAQRQFRNPSPSPITMEIEVIMAKYAHYRSDLLTNRHLEELEEDDEDAVSLQDDEDAEDDVDIQDLLEEPEEGAEEAPEASEEEPEPLPEHPMGNFRPPRQAGRRLSPEEL